MVSLYILSAIVTVIENSLMGSALLLVQQGKTPVDFPHHLINLLLHTGYLTLGRQRLGHVQF